MFYTKIKIFSSKSKLEQNIYPKSVIRECIKLFVKYFID